MTAAALIVAAGRGLRAGGGVTPKQYVRVGGVPVLTQVLQTFAAAADIGVLQVVIHPDDIELYKSCVPLHAPKLMAPVMGGATRQASVRMGLEALASHAPDRVLIHDAARPFVSPGTITDVIRALDGHAGAIAAVAVADTLKRARPDSTIGATIDRAGLWHAQTPQGFRFKDILDAHRKAAIAGHDDFTDDAAIAEWAGLAVALVPGSTANVKLTSAADIELANQRLHAAQGLMFEPRTGTGFDVHRFTDGASVWLCGVEIPHSAKLDGHSDADVGLHALTDAILGALGDGDIGQHFPPSDPQWKGAASRMFLTDAARRVSERHGRIVNVDITLLCEAPRIGPHRPQMQAAIAGVLSIEPGRVGIKATTTEGLGFTGRREGIAAMASALILLPIGT